MFSAQIVHSHGLSLNLRAFLMELLTHVLHNARQQLATSAATATVPTMMPRRLFGLRSGTGYYTNNS